MPPPSQLALSPFEMFREPLMVLGIADATELNFGSPESSDAKESNESKNDIISAFQELKEEYPRALVQKIILFDYAGPSNTPKFHEDVIFVPPVNELKTTTIRTMMCDITSQFLAEMTTLAISIKALPSIASPSTSQSGSNGVGGNQLYGDESPALSRTNSQTGDSGRSASPAVSNLHRMSMPVFPSSSPGLDDNANGTPRSPENGRDTPPPRTFEEISGSDYGISGHPSSRPASTNISREHSRDRVSVHGFGPGSINERNRNKGKARVSLVVGALYLQAGRWPDALREFAEGAAKSRSFSDHLWHAKALENMVICMILLAWSGAEFKVRCVIRKIPLSAASES
jgi:hypothetical protein